MHAQLEDAFEILERITDGFFAVDKCWNFTYINKEAARLLFRSQADLIGKNVWTEFPKAVDLKFHEQYHKAINEQVPVTFDAYFSPLSTWFDVRAYPSPNGLTVYFRDVTKAKRESVQKEQHYKSLFQQNPDAVFSFDLKGNYLAVNPAMERLLGYSEEEYLQKTFEPMVSEDDKDRTLHHYNIAVGGTTQRYQNKALHKDGSIIHVDVTNMPLIVNNEVIGVYGIAKDITSKKKSEDALKAKTYQLESFIENNGDAILIFGKQGKVIQVNQAFENTFGWFKEEIIDLPLYKLPIIPSEVIDEVKKFEAMVKKGHYVIRSETTRLHKDGSTINVLLSISPIKDAIGHNDGWSVILKDITEWKKSQEMMQNTEKLSIAGQLAAGIAHEIRNPITAIKGFIQLMNSDIDGYNEYFDIIISEIKRIELILSELLILAKPQVKKLERKDINVLMDQVITLLDSQAILNNVEIITEFDTEDTYIQCDENQLKQVFINYIKNAIEAMPKGGKLLIQIKQRDEDKLNICFKDEGVGMTIETLSKLGQPFYTTKENGTGLGFMISKKIIENHLGEVHIMSEPNQGTTIDVILPLE
ncbi:PAS domain S-box protein [Neobacillus cucumis]|uniref:histidine kinase n=1 Tax=Neobacillus cucumis TaxID=1740721 RepID=A0A2N5HVM8_9BACI|nr:PAS domain S-box protein [Neobacillus cucumis]PLS09567.1 PAS domain-containing sensor histidine kinase [Neobacillus cucumis]